MTTDAVKHTCEQWISAGYGEECLWEDWLDCPSEDSLTPNQVMAAVAKLEDENQRLRLALRIIAGYEQCLDNLMSNTDVARTALNKETNQ